jgi:collagen type III alpha/collagen type V/XI/XXIV/XXVII alpha
MIVWAAMFHPWRRPRYSKGTTVRELAAVLMTELRGLEDRVEVLGEEEGPMVALKPGAALEAVRPEPFKSI